MRWTIAPSPHRGIEMQEFRCFPGGEAANVSPVCPNHPAIFLLRLVPEIIEYGVTGLSSITKKRRSPPLIALARSIVAACAKNSKGASASIEWLTTICSYIRCLRGLCASRIEPAFR